MYSPLLSSIVQFFIDPFNIFLFLLAGTFWAFKTQRKRLTRILGITTLTFLILIATPLIPGFIINSLERTSTPIETEEIRQNGSPFHILVLGGGHGFEKELPASTLLSDNTLRRLNEAIRLHKQLPASKLILSGYSTVGGFTGAEMLQKAAISLGVDSASTILQGEPVNTYEQAKHYAKAYGNSHSVILVTSAAHIPRSMLFFRYFGINPIPAPTDYRLTGHRKNR